MVVLNVVSFILSIFQSRVSRIDLVRMGAPMVGSGENVGLEVGLPPYKKYSLSPVSPGSEMSLIFPLEVSGLA